MVAPAEVDRECLTVVAVAVAMVVYDRQVGEPIPIEIASSDDAPEPVVVSTGGLEAGGGQERSVPTAHGQVDAREPEHREGQVHPPVGTQVHGHRVERLFRKI